jgi:carboxyl-terminal processing protease
MLKKSLLPVAIIFVLVSCGGSSSQTPIESGFESCSVPDQNAVFFEFLQNTYLWYDQLPTSINPESYSSVNEMLDDVRFEDDRFSGFQAKQDFDDFFENATFVGFGFSSDTASNPNAYIVRYVFENSAAQQAGLRRGDKLTNINGFSVPEIRAQQLSNEAVFGPNEEGFTIDITFIKPSGTLVETQMSKVAVTTNTVFATQVFSSNVGQVGYLSFQNGFIEPSNEELDTSFTQLANEQVSELIVDLRYNGGGRLSVAGNLASYIVGSPAVNDIFTTLEFNDKNSDRNSSVRFTDKINALDLTRVVVLTTPNTCSASELIINGLSPHMEVVTIGSNTCGKPVGQTPDEYCDVVLSAINFRTVNSLGQGDYFDGLMPTCAVQDQIVADWGSLDDPVFAEGLNYLNTGNCSPAVSNRATTDISKTNVSQQDQAPINYQQLLTEHLH